MGANSYRPDEVLRLVSLLYDTVGAPDRWDPLLDELRWLTDSDNASLQHYNKRRQRQELAVTQNIDPDAVRAFDSYYAKLNPWLEAGIPRGFYKPGEIVLSHEIVPDRKFRQTEFCSDFAVQNDAFYSLGMTIAENDRYSAMFSVQRGHRRPAYSHADRELFRHLVPHFQRVLQLHNLVSEQRQARQALLATLDCLPLGVLLVTREGRIRFANEAAGRLLSENDGLSSRQDHLVAATPDQTRDLERRIVNAAVTTAGQGTDPGGALSLARPSGLRPLSVLVTPLPRVEFQSRHGQPLVGVFISDPEQPATALQQTVRKLYDLTPAEARLAATLIEGYELPRAARQLGIAYETARNHLKSILTKTGARHQGELLRILLTGPALFESDV